MIFLFKRSLLDFFCIITFINSSLLWLLYSPAGVFLMIACAAETEAVVGAGLVVPKTIICQFYCIIRLLSKCNSIFLKLHFSMCAFSILRHSVVLSIPQETETS